MCPGCTHINRVETKNSTGDLRRRVVSLYVRICVLSALYYNSYHVIGLLVVFVNKF